MRRPAPATLGPALAALATLALPLLLLRGEPRAPASAWLAWLGLAVGAAGLWAWRRGGRWVGGRGSTSAALLAGAGLTVGAAAVWNRLYWGLLEVQSLNREVFRRAMRTGFAPLYGQPAPEAPWRALAPTALVVALAAAWAWRRTPARWGWRDWAALLVLQAGLIVAFAASEPALSPDTGRPTGASRLTARAPGYGLFDADARAFASAPEMLRTYVERMPTLGWFGQHYPPGNLLLARLDDATGRRASLAFTVACVVAATPLVWLLAASCGAGTLGRNAAAGLFALSTGVLVYPTLSPTAAVVLPAAACCWLAVRSVAGAPDRRAVAAAAALGATWAAFSFFSYSAAVFGLLLAAAVVVGTYEGVIDARRAAASVALAALTATGLFALAYLLTGFDALASLRLAVRLHHGQQMDGAFDSPARYLIRSTGNLLAYATSALPLTGLAGAAAWVAARDGCRSVADVLAKAVAVALLATAFSGSFFLETERIWLFLTPALASVAGAWVGRRAGVEAPGVGPFAVVLGLALAAASEVAFMHYRP